MEIQSGKLRPRNAKPSLMAGRRWACHLNARSGGGDVLHDIFVHDYRRAYSARIIAASSGQTPRVSGRANNSHSARARVREGESERVTL